MWPMNRYDTFLGSLNYGSDIHDDTEIISPPNQVRTYPNPFKSEVQIECKTDTAEELEINIYNLKGQLVRTLASKPNGDKIHSLTWDGMDAHKRNCSAGIYLLRTKGKTFTQVHKVVKLKH